LHDTLSEECRSHADIIVAFVKFVFVATCVTVYGFVTKTSWTG